MVLESKCLNSGVRAKLYTSHPALMYHFIRFADIGFVGNLNTYTHQDFWLRSIVIIGSLNVSVYIFDDITKAFANIRLSLAIVRPVFQVDDDGMVISTLARIIKVKDFPRMSQFFKMKFIVFKHVWEHINENEVVISRYLNVEALALQLSDMYEGLGNVIFILLCPNLNSLSQQCYMTDSYKTVNCTKLQSCLCRRKNFKTSE